MGFFLTFQSASGAYEVKVPYPSRKFCYIFAGTARIE